MLALGAETYAGGDPTVFNMAVMGLRLAQRANGVAKLHGVVSRGMFNGLWPSFDTDEVPIASVTNGVHAPTWVAREVFELAARAIGPRPHRGGAWLGGHRRRPRARDLGACGDTLRGHLVDEAPHPAQGVLAAARAPAPASSAGSTTSSTPTC